MHVENLETLSIQRWKLQKNMYAEWLNVWIFHVWYIISLYTIMQHAKSRASLTSAVVGLMYGCARNSTVMGPWVMACMRCRRHPLYQRVNFSSWSVMGEGKTHFFCSLTASWATTRKTSSTSSSVFPDELLALLSSIQAFPLILWSVSVLAFPSSRYGQKQAFKFQDLKLIMILDVIWSIL